MTLTQALLAYVLAGTVAKWAFDYQIPGPYERTVGEMWKNDSPVGYAYVLALWPVTLLVLAVFTYGPAALKGLKSALGAMGKRVGSLSITRCYQDVYKSLKQ